MKSILKYTIPLLLFTFLVACNPSQKVERRGGYLLVKNTIKNKNTYLPYDELEGFLQQTAIPGRLAPFFRPGISIYENSMKGKETRFKVFKRNKLGKKPVILDTVLVKVSVDKLKIYLRNKGFYHATVTSSIYRHKTTATVTYTINTGLPCIVGNFEYIVPDSIMYGYLMADADNGKLRKGMIYDTYVLDDERDRIATMYRNNSYFNFSLSDIYYVVDTTNAGLAADVELHIKKIKIKIPGTNDSTAEIQHPRFYIKNIYITPNGDISSPVKAYDTLAYTYHLSKFDTTSKTIYILYNNRLTLKPSFLASNLQFKQGDTYSQSDANKTYKKLISRPIIGSANISMTIENPELINPTEKQWLDCNIRLVHNSLNAYSFGTEGTNSGGRFGMGLNTTIQNRNVFRGAEVLSLKLHTSAELQGSLNNQVAQSDKYFLLFSTLEGGAEASIDFPHLLIPYRSKYLQKVSQGNTSVSAGAGFEFRPQYKRSISSAAWSYKWTPSEKIHHIFTPVELSYINITTSDAFKLYLDSLNDPQYKSQYTNHLLTMIRYSFILSNMGLTKLNNQFFLRLNAETSGNMLYLVDNLSNKSLTDSTYYEHLGVRYSQYFRFDFDYRKYWKLRYKNSLAFRFIGGIALPYGNSESVPFEKSFWLGGANDMRGWRLRSLGPGGYADSTLSYDKTGDIMFQSSLEHRFPIYSFLLGSLFIDAGNVWLREPSKDFSNAEFKLNKFYKQIALDMGFGLRFDFSFFIFRLDAAIPIKNPALTNRWFYKDEFKIRNSVLNFGIGYPF